MFPHGASAFLLCLTNALLVYRGAVSLEAQTETSGITETEHERTLGKTAGDDEILKNILPLVTFDCLGKSGYFADKKFDCEVFHYCDPDGSRSTFHCPSNFFFNSELMVCEQISESKRSLCWKKEDGNSKDKKSVNKNASDAKTMSTGNNKKEKSEKYSSSKGSVPELISSGTTVPTSSKTSDMDGIMTLEDMLSYMNSDNDPEHPRTFISSFKMSGDRSSKALVNTSIISPFKKLDVRKSSIDEQQNVNVQNISPKKQKIESEENSDAYKKKPKKRQRGRRGRMLKYDGSWSQVTGGGHHHSHISERSPAENPDQEDRMEERQNYGMWDAKVTSTEIPPSSGNLRLFDIESRRNTTDPWRKRRRHYRRRRKYKNPSSSPIYEEHLQDNSTDLYEPDSERIPRRRGKKLDAAEWHRSVSIPDASRPRDFNQETDHSFQTDSTNKSHGYNLASSISNSEDKTPENSQKNPWFKPTMTTDDDNYNIRFGERTTTSGTGFAPEPYYGDENGSMVTSHSFSFEEKPQHDGIQHSKLTVHSDESVGQKPKVKLHSEKKSGSSKRGTIRASERRPAGDHKYSDWNPEETNEKEKRWPDSAPRDQVKGFVPPQKQEQQWNNKWSPMVTEITTLVPPATLKSSFHETYDPNIPAFVEGDGIRWKQREQAERGEKAKVSVGSSYKRWKEEPKKHAEEKSVFNSSVLNSTSPAEKEKSEMKPVPQSVRNVYRDRKKEWPKHTLAHQHLSKVMNDFLSIPPGNLGLPKVGPIVSAVPFETYVPKYRIPYEDIYMSESIAKDVVKNQPDIYDIVDLVTKNSRGKLKETTKASTDEMEEHRLSIKDALLAVKSLTANKEKLTSSGVDIGNLREILEEIFSADIEELLENESSKEHIPDNESPRVIKGSIRKLAELSKEQQEEFKEIAQIAKFTSLRLKPILSSVLGDSSKEQSGGSKDKEKRTPSRPAILTAKKVRLVYSDEISTSKESAPKLVTMRPTIKVVRHRQQIPQVKVMRRPHRPHPPLPPPPRHPAQPPVPPSNIPFMILHPPSLRPPHPPPLPPKQTFPVMHMPYAGIRPVMYHQRRPYIPRRRKRSPQFLFPRHLGLRRWSYSPFAHGVLPSFPSNYGSPFFRRPITPHRFPAPTLPSPFRLPYSLTGNNGFMRKRKPRLRKPVFLPRQPVRNVPQPAHQTVIIEEVPIPIPVEVPDLAQVRVPPRKTVRATQRPMELQNQRGQSTMHLKPGQFQHPPFPFGIGVLETLPVSRPPPTQFSQNSKPNQAVALSTAVREPKFQFALPNPVTPFPLGINPTNSRNPPNRAVKPKPPLLLAPAEFHKRPQPAHFAFPFDTKSLHLSNYPNFPYFQTGAQRPFVPFFPPEKEKNFRIPDNATGNNKPPKPPGETKNRPNAARPGKIFESRYRETSGRGSTPSSVGITTSPGGLFVVSPPDSTVFAHNLTPNSYSTQSGPLTKYDWGDDSKESTENGVPDQRQKPEPNSAERKNRRRRPGARRRRPRPNVTQGDHNSTKVTPSDIKPSLSVWRTNPPQQIPPPPSELTNDPLTFSLQNQDKNNAINQLSINIPSHDGINVSDVRSVFPQAGYYGSEQLSQILETSFSNSGPGVNVATPSDTSREEKLPTFSTTERPATEEQNTFSQEEAAFYDDETGVHSGVPFGTRLKNKPRTRANSRQNVRFQTSSQEDLKDNKNGQSMSPSQERYHVNRGTTYREPAVQSTDIRDTLQPPRRRKPERARYSEQNSRPNKQPDVRGIRPEVIYYDTREHPDGLFKIESEIRDSKPPTPILMRTPPGSRDMFHLPNPYADRDLFGMHPPTSKPLSNGGFYGVTHPRNSPRDQVIPRRPHMDQNSSGDLRVLNAPTRSSGFRQGGSSNRAPDTESQQNNQHQFRPRERKRPTSQPKLKSEERVRTSSVIPETTTTTRPHLYSTQIDHKPKEVQKQEQPYYQHRQVTAVSPKDVVTQKWTVKTTTPVPLTVPETSISERIVTTTASYPDIKTTHAKSIGLLPVREISKVVQGAKLDLHKINATISTSVSVSSSAGSTNHVTSAETSAEGQPKKVFSSKNGGLAVVRKGGRQRKRNRNRQRTTTIPKIETVSSGENVLNDHEKLQIAASVQDIIKATSETDRNQETPSSPILEASNSTAASTKVSKKWILPPPQEDVPQAKQTT